MLNAVKLDGNWYIVDAAENDIVQSNYQYFLIGSESFDSPADIENSAMEIAGITLSKKNYPCSR